MSNKGNEMNRQEEQLPNGADGTAKAKVAQRGLGKWFWLWVGLFVVVVGIGYAVRDSGNGTIRKWFKVGASSSEEEMPPDETVKLRKDIEARYTQFKNEVKAIEGKYRTMLPLAEAEPHFKEAEQGAEFIASREGLCGFKVCVKLAYKMAYDKIKKTNTAEDAIVPVVTEKIVRPIEKSAGVYENWVREYRQELQKADQEFSQDLAMRSSRLNGSLSVIKTEDAQKVGESLDQLVSDIRDHAQESVFAGMEVALEAAMIQSSYVAIKKAVTGVASVALASVVKKVATTASAAAISAAADGPLPFGDLIGGAIALAGFTWTAYDVYKVTKSMPEDMRKSILDSVNGAKKAMQESANKKLDADVEACLKSASERVRELNAVIK